MRLQQVSLDRMIDFILPWLDVVGCNPKNDSGFALLRWIFANIHMAIFWSLIVAHFAVSIREGITVSSVESALNSFLLSQFVAKYLFYRYYAKALKNIMKTITTEFWRPEAFGSEGESFSKMHRYIYITMNVYRYGYVILNGCYGIEPIFYGTRNLRLPIYFPWPDLMTKTPYYELLYFYELCSIVSADFAMAHFELLSFLLLGTAWVQMEMLKAKLKTVDSYDVITSCIKHHTMILGYLEQIKATFSVIMFQQVITYCMAIALPSFLFTTNRTVTVGFCICALINIVNFFFYCLLGQYLLDQCESVSDAVYESGWWQSQDKRLKQAVLFIMKRSSKGVIFTALGVVDFTLDTFIKAMRTTVSIIQILWSTNNKEVQ